MSSSTSAAPSAAGEPDATPGGQLTAEEVEDKQKRLPNEPGAALLAVADPEAELRTCLERVVAECAPAAVHARAARDDADGGGGLLLGPCGLAYLFLHLSRERPGLTVGGRPSLEWARLYLGEAPPPTVVTPAKCGVVEQELCWCAVATAVLGTDAYVDRFLSHLPGLVEDPAGAHPGADVVWDEFVYGRGALLYMLRLMARWHPPCAARLEPWRRKTCDALLAAGPPWIFFGRDDIATAHGRMGVIVQVLLTDPSYAPRLEPLVAELIDCQLPNGNWPSYFPGSGGPAGRDYLVQWCHGAPGLVQSLVRLRALFPDLHARIDAAVARGREHTWRKGLICKTPNLCHGITGNALVTFDPSARRDHFLAHTTDAYVRAAEAGGVFETADYGFPHSLWLGWVGRAVGWLWRARPIEDGVFMGYDDV